MIMIGYVLLALVSASLFILYALARRQHIVDDFKSWGRNVLLVIAHPDDEAMFFVPTIAHLVESGAQVHILCLSSGNYDGLGAVRSLELQASARVLRATKAVCVEHAQLQDGPHSDWPPAVIAEHVHDYCRAHNIDSVREGGIEAKGRTRRATSLTHLTRDSLCCCSHTLARSPARSPRSTLAACRATRIT